MKKLYLLLIVCATLPFSVFSSISDVKVENGIEKIIVQPECGVPTYQPKEFS